jgi:hypothetical protein
MNWPAGQSTQKDWPLEDWNRPCEQSVQPKDALALENRPG